MPTINLLPSRYRMFRLVYLVFIAVFLCLSQDTIAQGDVVVHAPSGMDALIKKKKPVEKAPVNASPTQSVSKTKPAQQKAIQNNPGEFQPAKTKKSVDPVVVINTPEPKRAAYTDNPVHLVSYTRQKGSGIIYSGKGFRVQIYYGPDRAKAVQVKAEFMRNFPDVRTYLNYLSPTFRVKVGDYRNRSDAEGMLREARSIFGGPCMIVPDIITINTF